MFRFERWIPAKWMELHRTYLRASELGIERDAAVLGGAGPNGTQWTVEQEYLFVLLLHQLNTGNMSPPQLDWAMAQLRAWSRRLQMDAVPRSPEGFFVDIAGKTGLGRRTGNDSGSMLRYLDTTPLAESLERAITALRQAETTDQGPAGPINQLRIAILEKVSPSISPNLNAELRRDPRIACAVAAKVRIGLSRVCHELMQKDTADVLSDAGAGSEQIEVYAVAGGPRARRHVPDEHDSLAASLSSFSDPMWQVKDRSVAGLRIAASGGIGQALTLGALVAVRQSDLSDWVLGVVRRLNKVSNDEVEAGMSIIAERLVPVTLHAVRQAKEDMGFIVDGIDVSTMGARFHGLYLPPPSRPDKPLAVKTLIVPTQEYSEGRNVMLTTGRSVYTVALRHLVEQRADWSWAAIQIVEKKSRISVTANFAKKSLREISVPMKSARKASGGRALFAQKLQRSAPIVTPLRGRLSSARMRLTAFDWRTRSFGIHVAYARYRTAAQRLMIGALRAFSTRKARGRPKPFVLTSSGANCARLRSSFARNLRTFSRVGRNLRVRARWKRSARSGRGSGDDLRIARCTASS